MMGNEHARVFQESSLAWSRKKDFRLRAVQLVPLLGLPSGMQDNRKFNEAVTKEQVDNPR